MSERNVLAACIASREAYNTIEHNVKEGEFREQGNIIFESIKEYYSRDGNARRCDGELLSANIMRGLSSPKHQEMFEQLVVSLVGAEVSPENIVFDFEENANHVDLESTSGVATLRSELNFRFFD